MRSCGRCRRPARPIPASPQGPDGLADEAQFRIAASRDAGAARSSRGTSSSRPTTSTREARGRVARPHRALADASRSSDRDGRRRCARLCAPGGAAGARRSRRADRLRVRHEHGRRGRAGLREVRQRARGDQGRAQRRGQQRQGDRPRVAARLRRCCAARRCSASSSGCSARRASRVSGRQPPSSRPTSCTASAMCSIAGPPRWRCSQPPRSGPVSAGSSRRSHLVDGAVVSRIPFDLVHRRRCGLKIAVNVIPSAAQRDAGGASSARASTIVRSLHGPAPCDRRLVGAARVVARRRRSAGRRLPDRARHRR